MYRQRVTAQIVSWAPDNCFCCRRPIVLGAKWVELVNDNDRARFHFDCATAWKLRQETAARRALGLKLEPALTEKTP
jgi:gamma-glutamylcysteine synthetase